MSSFASVQALADEVQPGLARVHLLCNNAGVASTARLADMALSDWQWLLGVNLWGVIHGIKAFLPLLKANPDGGHLVNTASMSGFHVTPDMGGYSVSKFAVVALSETLALELAEDGSKVGVTVLCPGPVSTSLRLQPAQSSEKASRRCFHRPRSGSGQGWRDAVARMAMQLPKFCCVPSGAGISMPLHIRNGHPSCARGKRR